VESIKKLKREIESIVLFFNASKCYNSDESYL
jgi:hypothetical protein